MYLGHPVTAERFESGREKDERVFLKSALSLEQVDKKTNQSSRNSSDMALMRILLFSFLASICNKKT